MREFDIGGMKNGRDWRSNKRRRRQRPIQLEMLFLFITSLPSILPCMSFSAALLRGSLFLFSFSGFPYVKKNKRNEEKFCFKGKEVKKIEPSLPTSKIRGAAVSTARCVLLPLFSLSMGARSCVFVDTNTHPKSQRKNFPIALSSLTLLADVNQKEKNPHQWTFPPAGASRYLPNPAESNCAGLFSWLSPEMFCCLLYRNHLHLPIGNDETREFGNKKPVLWGSIEGQQVQECYTPGETKPNNKNIYMYICAFTLMAC